MFANDIKAAKHEAQHMANHHQVPVRVYRLENGRLSIRPPWSGRPDGNFKWVATLRPKYRSVEDIKKRNEAGGGKWFAAENMRVFGCRVQGAIYCHRDGRAFFVSSERDRYDGPGGGAWGGRRKYSVRVAEVDGRINTVGEFGTYTTGREAHRAARLASEG